MTQVNYLKTVIPLNIYPHYIWTKIIKQSQSRQNSQRKNDDQVKENLPVIFFKKTHAGAQGDRLVKNVVKKLKRIFSKLFILKSFYKTTEMNYYCNTTYRIPDYLKFHVVNEFCSPTCNANYIGKTDQNLGAR